MKTILILIILLALPVSFTWAQFFSNLADCKTAEDSAKNLIQVDSNPSWGQDYKEITWALNRYVDSAFTCDTLGHRVPDTLTHYQVTDTTVDTTTGWWIFSSIIATSKYDSLIIDSVPKLELIIDTTWHKKIPVCLTPDEYKRLMEMLEYPKIDTHHITGGQWIPIQSDTFGLSIHEKIPERGEHFIPIIFINTPGLIGCADTIWVDTTNPNTYVRVTTSGEPLNRFYGMGIENDWKYEITIEFISDGIEKRESKGVLFYGSPPDSFGIFDSAFKKADKEFEWWLSEDSAFWDSIINHMKKED